MKWVCLHRIIALSHAHWTSESHKFGLQVVFLFPNLTCLHHIPNSVLYIEKFLINVLDIRVSTLLKHFFNAKMAMPDLRRCSLNLY